MAERELLIQLEKKNMVEMVALGELFRAENIFEAAWKMTKSNLTWLQNQVYMQMQNITISLLTLIDKPLSEKLFQDGGKAEVKRLSKDTLVRLLWTS